VESRSYYGTGYQDVQHRKPSIRNARRLLKWTPTVGLEESVERTLNFFLSEAIRCGEFEVNRDASRDLSQAFSCTGDLPAGGCNGS